MIKKKIITELEIFFNITESTLFQDIYGFSEVNNVRHPIKNSDFSRQAKHYMGIGGFKGLTKAIELYNLALKSDIKTYGEADPKVATIRNNLAHAFKDRNQFSAKLYNSQDLAKAIELYNLALESDIKTYGESHPKVAVIRCNLARALEARNQSQDLVEVIELRSLALESYIKTDSESHPEVAIIRHDLARALKARKQP